MKTVYIPKGETVRYESLMTEHLVVHGCLQVSNGIKARTITGQGTISAGTIDADVIRVDDVRRMAFRIFGFPLVVLAAIGNVPLAAVSVIYSDVHFCAAVLTEK